MVSNKIHMLRIHFESKFIGAVAGREKRKKKQKKFSHFLSSFLSFLAHSNSHLCQYVEVINFQSLLLKCLSTCCCCCSLLCEKYIEWKCLIFILASIFFRTKKTYKRDAKKFAACNGDKTSSFSLFA